MSVRAQVCAPLPALYCTYAHTAISVSLTPILSYPLSILEGIALVPGSVCGVAISSRRPGTPRYGGIVKIIHNCHHSRGTIHYAKRNASDSIAQTFEH